MTPQVLAAWRALDPRWRDAGFAHSDGGEIGARLTDLAVQRIAAHLRLLPPARVGHAERHLERALSALALKIPGPERILFSTDYPYRFTPDHGARRFLESTSLSDADRAAVAHGNWERLVASSGAAGAGGGHGPPPVDRGSRAMG